MADDGITDGKRQDEPEEAGAIGGPSGVGRQKGPCSSGRPPTVRDLQLALAGLYEDEIKRQSPHPGKPTTRVASHPRLPVQRFYSGDMEYRIVESSGNMSSSKIVDELFKEAREHGAVPLDEVSRASGDCHKAKSFSGGGYRLGDSARKHSEYIHGENQYGQDVSKTMVEILLKLWRNGFSLDDGELRSYTDPVNAQFLESVKRGEIPAELQRLVHGGQVNLDMEDHQEQEYVRPRLKFKAFSGEDATVPTTKIQIRLADGSRLIQRFNQTHRITDIRNFIVQSRPLFATTDFVLLTTFPHKELTDESLTLQESDILNTVILQQLK
ncbi:UBX domain-containing protein 2B, partial [Ophiophagus hannah]